MLKLNKAWVVSLALALLWALSASLSNAYTPAPSALATTQTVAPYKTAPFGRPSTGQADRKALGENPFLEPEDGSFAHWQFAKPLKLDFFLAHKLAENSPGIEIPLPKVVTPGTNPFAYLSTHLRL